MILQDELHVTTSDNNSTIQLYFGDITKLTKDEQVDVLVVSAYPGLLSVQGAK